MATGQNIQRGRGIQVSDIAPSVDLETGEAQMWKAVGGLADQITDAAKPGMVRKAEAKGQADAATLLAGGEVAQPLLRFGDVYEARLAATEEAYVAGRANDFDVAEAALKAEHAANLPEYERAAAALQDRYIEQAEPQFAVQLETYMTRRIGAGRAAVADQAGRIAVQEANVEIGTRQGSLTNQLVRMLRDGESLSPEYKLLDDERNALIQSRLNNPAIAYTEAEAASDDREFMVASKAAVFTNHAVTTLRSAGPDAAIASLQEILTTPDLEPDERQSAFEAARAAVNQEIDLSNDRANIATATRARVETEMNRRIEDDAAAIEIGAGPTNLSEGEVQAALGASGVAEWRRKQAEASERNRLTGDLVGLPRDEAIRRATAALSGGNRTNIDDLSGPLNTPEDFDALAAAIRMVETGNNPARISRDPDGAGPAGGGAVGAMQLLPGTARDMARLEGLPYDENRLLNDPEYNQRLGRRYLQQLVAEYDGSAVLAATAYHAGSGNVNGWLQPVGTVTVVDGKRVVGKGDPRTGEITIDQWLDRIEQAGNPRSAEYPRKVAEALGQGRNSAAWRATQAETLVTNATQGFASDPLAFASSHRLAALPPLAVDGVFQGGQSAASWQEGLRARVNLGQQLADQRGAPLRLLTNGERAAYKDRIERDPGQAVTLARAATAAIGGRGARDLLAEIGQGSDASTPIHIADLAATGGDGRFADAAAHGLTLRAAGQTLPTPRRDEVTAEIVRWRPLLAQNPSLLSAVQNTALAAALADDVSGVERPASYYVQAALGRTTWGQNKYGGAAEVNGASVIVPRWLNGDKFEDALELLAETWVSGGRGPVFGNGEPMPARTASRLRPVASPTGNFHLADERGRVAVTRDGRPFEINLEAARQTIRQRLGPDAVRPD
ncbi:transglycosylase SLT domain-containing protein [Brevundimonas sp.]|uniref:transglycosylase SLT domain-containing protein n=1 Tax=Brevundimonas sp. TaxID=1871086 RepID=UPI003BAC237A